MFGRIIFIDYKFQNRMLKDLKDLYKNGPIGKYSGSKRLDPHPLIEPDPDSEQTRKLWLEEVVQDPDYEIEIKADIDKFKQRIAQTSNPEKLRLHMIGQSHIDVAWKWRYEQTRQKGIKTLEKALLHAKLFPNQFTFALSEPVLLQWIIEDKPELMSDVQKAVESGAIELVGGSWLEPDCMMPCGEAFVRQRLYGQRFYRDHFHRLATVEWFLDSFGYNAGLPQILLKSGAKYFWTSKITWNRQTIFPFVNFWWESPDGSKILTSNFQQGWAPIDQWLRFEIGRHPIKTGGKRRWDYRDEYDEIGDEVDDNPDNVIPPVGIFFGAGDGGHGPTHQEVGFAQTMAKLSNNWAFWSTSEAFFKDIEQYGDTLPIWNDELYLEYHRGTFTIHYEVKRHNRYFERKLIALENLGTLLGITNKSYTFPVDNFEAIWKIVLLNHFHDVLPGSSIPEVYDDVFELWKECNKDIEALLNEWQKLLPVPKGTVITLSNPVAWSRKSPVFIPISTISLKLKPGTEGKPPYIRLIRVDDEKEVLIGQPVAKENGEQDDTREAGWFVVVYLDALATKCYKVEVLSDNPSEKIRATSTSIDNDIIKIDIDPKTGAILSILSPSLNDGKNLLHGNESNLTVGYLDNAKSDHAWNMLGDWGAPYWESPLVIPNDKNITIELIDNGPVFSTIQISKILGEGPIKEELIGNGPIGANQIWQKITIFKESPIVYLTYEADWKQPWLMLKIAYDTSTNAVSSVSDQAYCAIDRSTKPQSRCDKARFEKIMHTYADVSSPDFKWGVALINEGKYAYDVEGGKIRLTLLRTATYTPPSGEAWVNQERAKRKAEDGSTVPNYIDLGFFRCRYALYPHASGALKDSTNHPVSDVKRKAEEFNMPIIVIGKQNRPEGTSVFVQGKALMTCEPENVLITSIKQKEWEPSSNLIVRIVECSGFQTKDGVVKIHPEISRKIKEINMVDLLERKIDQKVNWIPNDNMFRFSIGKFEILSFEFILDN